MAISMNTLYRCCLAMQITLPVSCCDQSVSLKLPESASLISYSSSENDLARQRGFDISIGIECGDIFFKSKKHTIDTLKERIVSEIEAAKLTKEEQNRAPVLIQTRGPVKYGQIAEIIDFCAGCGFKVIGVISWTSPPDDAVPPTKPDNAIDMPCFDNGVPFEALDGYDNAICVQVLKNGFLQLDGILFNLANIDFLEMREKMRKIVIDKFGKDRLPYLLVCADRDADVWYVTSVMTLLDFETYTILVGNFHGNRIPPKENVGRYFGIVVDVPVPCPYFWGDDSSVWEERDE